ncbi:MAG: DUF1743 domain-containing protein [Candidatus Altiarchaeota archaeon]|nr:DUF1743 domain-containing protein [Candidatus Altiarchaeota archaeon]
MFIGIDDTDSEKCMCTTYLAAVLAEDLGVTKHVRLVRLNPNIPYKTRGNGAVALAAEGDPDKIRETVLDYVGRYAQTGDKRTNPGVVFIEDPDAEGWKELKSFYQRAVSELVSIEDAEKAAKKVGAQVHKYKNGRGIIGALAAIGADLSEDRTYELIAYRKSRNRAKRIDKESVHRMDEDTYPETFNNVDPKTGRILIVPRGYDPVFCGIRGNTPEIVLKAWSIIKPLEEIERVQVFVTNQGTDAHLREKDIKDVKPYDCVILEGTVGAVPKTVTGGHVIFGLSDGTGNIDCAAYKPSDEFRDVVRRIISGDRVRVCGGISKYPGTVNIEKIEVLALGKKYVKDIPVCCERKMTSSGKGKGLKCRKCGKKEKGYTLLEVPRDLDKGFYEPPPGARRHLAKPLIRMR